ncbi:MAG: Gfo/Idh/MocA family protein [Cyclobacteriaceae bacterium]
MKRRSFIRNTAAITTGAIFAPTIVPASVFGKNAPSNRINIAAIGTGRISQHHDMPGVWKYDHVQISSVCDVDSKRLTEAKQLVENHYSLKTGKNFTGVKMYEDYREMLLDKDIDAVLISTPEHWHAKQAIDAALAGKDIYMQKPSSLTIAEGRIMSDIVSRQGTIFQVGTQQRSSDQFRIACELVRNGRIGTLKNIQIGLPIDPAGENEPEMLVPKNLNYDMWLGPAEWMPYTEKRVHPQIDYSRPGWLRVEKFCLGMVTGWGSHHVDIAHWGMGTEYSGPIEIEATADFPTSGIWTVHGKYNIKAKYENGVTMQITDEFPNGIRFEGSDGWIFVTRGNYAATSSDPVSKDETPPLTASNPKILKSKIEPDEIHLYQSSDHHGNWVECIKTRQQPITPVEVGHRSTTACILGHIAMKIPRKLFWDPLKERFKNDDEANSYLSRPYRVPYLLDV